MPVHTLEAERLSSQKMIPPWVKVEHQARYEFASRFVKDKVVIDCACGTGAGTSLYLGAGAAQVLAFDVSESAVAETAARCNSPRVKAQFADALHLPLPDDYADVYISLETIEHIEQDEEFLQEVKRVLKPGGLFICSTPNRTLTNPGSAISDQPFNSFHVREYARQEFAGLLGRYFPAISLYGQNPCSSLRASFFHRLGNLLPRLLIARGNQVLKLPRLAWYNKSMATVQPVKEGLEYEYITAVCDF
jgi:ubiquinone/menaquinone biosynthesis C-methylase UbiE